MSREVRRVPPDWNHPKDARGKYIPLESGYIEYLHGKAQWERGFVSDYKGGWKPKDTEQNYSYEKYAGEKRAEEHMPVWPESVCTHFQMYETTTEGTPLSPPLPSAEELAHWLADNGASAFGDRNATYEQWLATIKRSWAPSGVDLGRGLISGVEAMHQEER